MSIRVVLVDDQEMVRTGFRMVLEEQNGLEIVGEAGDGETALELATQTRPDVVLMDVRMPLLDGVEATRRICRIDNGPRVLILTTFDLDEYVYEGLKAGASGFLLKDSPVEEIVAAIRHIHEGDAVVAPRITRRLLHHFTAEPLADDAPLDRGFFSQLTPREHEVLQLVAKGHSNAEIAQELVVSEGTVKIHVGRILTKLDLRDRVQAVVLAYESGFITASSSPK
ncbi:response regulator [Brevibacterium luteolum]|uniref:response regulator n=1 Tax=Brevibacterium luteolum TaxID=199591 RepID=UPI00223A9AC2|nr:response regulator transcription factor [Brevibacterium luteolum]MCT1874331.1 response regulator transcription factor [Brevibacterium luteolum]MCT1891555.1 response regulator transcription factor [Brevibacterium luteolum]MCT1893596.1 response regulator transcription factor [Brevibacterium luteolum]MCT1924886.1 response regulator transcription factor [Brevibacterium luteolum]